MLKFAYQLGFELALQEELQKAAGIPGAGFAIPKAEIAKALAKPKPVPTAQPGLWDTIKGWFSSSPAPQQMKTITHVNLPKSGAGGMPSRSYRGGTGR